MVESAGGLRAKLWRSATSVGAQGVAVLARRSPLVHRRKASAALMSERAGVAGALVTLVLTCGLFLLPQGRPLPWNLYIGAWLPLPGQTADLVISYDAVSHFFAFFAIAITSAVLLSPRTWRSMNWWDALLLLLALMAFTASVAVPALVIVYMLWELTGWTVLLLRRQRCVEDEQWPFPRLTYVAGYGLLAAAILLGSGDSARLAGATYDKHVLVVTLLLVAAAGRSGLFPFHGWTKRWAALPVVAAVALMGGMAATGGPFLLARTLQLSGGTWPAEGRALATAFALVATTASSLLAWRASAPLVVMAYALAADAGMAFLAMIAGTPAALSAGLLLCAGNGLALSALCLAPLSIGHERQPAVALRIGRASGVVGAASLVGLPPLIGFAARWQLLAALWQDGSIVSVAVLLLATVPRTIAVLRAAQSLLGLRSKTALAEHLKHERPFLSATLVPGFFVALFSALPWLPQRHLVLPAVEAISGQRSAATEMAALPLPVVIGSGALLLGGLALALFYIPLARERLAQTGELFWLPYRWSDGATALGSLGRSLGAAVVVAGERVEGLLITMADALVERSGQRLGALLPPLEERHYLAAILMVGISVAFVLAE